MSKKKKIVLLSCMVALLAVTAVFNFVMTTPTGANTETTVITGANYFSQYRNERVSSRNEEILQLDSVIAAADEGSAAKNEALSLKTKLSYITEKEMLLECLIKAYGFEDAVVVIGIDSDNVNVITKSETLSADDAIAIYTILSEEISASPENVKIIPIS